MARPVRDKFFYTSIAADFDGMMNPYDLQRRLEVVFDCLLPGDLAARLVLDVGCGTGWFSERAHSRGARVVALDLGTSLLREALRKAPVLPVVGDALALPFLSSSFDFVVSSEAVEHTVDPATAISEMARVLRPGGILAVTCPNRVWRWLITVADLAGLRPYKGFENFPSFGGLERAIAAAGLELVSHIGFHPWPFQLRFLWRASRWVDSKLGSRAPGRFMINQGARAIKSGVHER